MSSDIFSVGIILLQLDNIQNFSYDSTEDVLKDYNEFFSKGLIPPNLNLQTNSIFYRAAEKMISNEKDRLTCSFYLNMFKDYINEKKIHLSIRIES